MMNGTDLVADVVKTFPWCLDRTELVSLAQAVDAYNDAAGRSCGAEVGSRAWLRDVADTHRCADEIMRACVALGISRTSPRRVEYERESRR